MAACVEYFYNLTRYGVHLKRGRKALEALGWIPQFKGELVHDGRSAYQAFNHCGHALYNTHLLRELTFLMQQHKQQWAADLKTLLLDIKQAVEQASTQGQTALDEFEYRNFIPRYTTLPCFHQRQDFVGNSGDCLGRHLHAIHL